MDMRFFLFEFVAALHSLRPDASLLHSARSIGQFFQAGVIDYTAQNPFGRLPDGRPKVPDDLIERARGLSSEEVWAGHAGKGIQQPVC